MVNLDLHSMFSDTQIYKINVYVCYVLVTNY